MPIDAKLLEILRCPVTKQHLNYVREEELSTLNEMIRGGTLSHQDGSTVENELTAALITENRSAIYKIEDDIPIMLEELSIAGTVLS